MATCKHRSATVTDGKVDRCFFAVLTFFIDSSAIPQAVNITLCSVEAAETPQETFDMSRVVAGLS
jgi:hypothetical protein